MKCMVMPYDIPTPANGVEDSYLWTWTLLKKRLEPRFFSIGRGFGLLRFCKVFTIAIDFILPN